MNSAGTIGSQPTADAFRRFHTRLPLAGDPPNALLLLPDDLIVYLASAVSDMPCRPPALPMTDWNHVIDLLRPHWITPLLASHLRTWPQDFQPPPEIMSVLSQGFLVGAARNLLIGRQIQTITAALEDAGIPVLLLKGHALARTVYPDPALRQASDIDLLVQPEHVEACEEVFLKLGYSCPAPTFRISHYEHHHEIFFPSRKGVPVELHWTADLNFGMFPKTWLADAFGRKIRLASVDLSCYTLNHADHLLYLAFHNAFQHSYVRLDWVYDIALLLFRLRVPDDWQRLQEECVKMHIRIPMELTLTAASLWTGYAIPQEFRDFFGWPAPSERERRLWRHAVARHENLRSFLFLRIHGIPGITEKLRFCSHFILPPRELLAEYRRSSSPADIPLAHLRRWFGIVRYR